MNKQRRTVLKSLGRTVAELRLCKMPGMPEIDMSRHKETEDPILILMIENALTNGMRFGQDSDVTVLSPSATTRYAIPTCLELARLHQPGATFRPGHTEVEQDGVTHYFPRVFLEPYRHSSHIIIATDVVATGSVVRGIATMIRSIFQETAIIAMCIADFGRQTASSLNVDEFHPLIQPYNP